MTTPAQSVDTAKVAGFRTLRFKTIDDALAEVDRCVAADSAGRLRRVGNWTAGQALGHLASWVNYGFDGAPTTPPWFVRVLSRMMKRKFLNNPLPRGFSIPKVQGGTHGTELMSTDDGAARYRRAMERLRAAAPARANAVFGPLTHDEWVRLQLRHAELHLGFLVPQ